VTPGGGGPRATVVIPTRNRLPLLREAIASVERQTFPDWEAVVVDDDSSDGTPPWLDGLSDSRIRSFRLREHSERTVARNVGLREARGEIVVFLDDDDRLLPHALGLLCGALERHADAVAAVGAAVRFDPGGRRERAPHPRTASVRSVWREVLAGWDSGSGQAAFRASDLRRAGGWNEQLTYWELGDLWFRVARAGPVVFLPQVVLELRLHAGQTPSDLPTEDPRAAFLAALPEPDRREGSRVLRARQSVRAGDEARFRGDHRHALACYLRAVVTSPLLVRSPLTRPDLVGNMAREAARTLLGRRGAAGVRRLRKLARSRSA
jgi:glycosyltransferase involved in cell wall biosynthesis